MTTVLQAAGLVVGACLLALALLPLIAAVEILRTNRKEFDRIGESKAQWLAIVLIGWVPGTIAYAMRVRRHLLR